MLAKITRFVLLLPAVLFLVLGLRWLVDPSGVAPEFGYDLATGLGRSSQVGDMSGYFLMLSVCLLTAVVTNTRSWLYAPALLLALTAFGRIISWLLHGADLAVPMIAVEVVTTVVMFVAASQMRDARGPDDH